VTPLRVAIVGSRVFLCPDMVLDFVRALPRDGSIVVVSGAATGRKSNRHLNVDRIAVDEAICLGIPTYEIPVTAEEWRRLGSAAGFVRNGKVVDDVDVVVAFWDAASSGTAITIRLALLNGLPVYVVLADPWLGSPAWVMDRLEAAGRSAKDRHALLSVSGVAPPRSTE
jgi:hypothetical protein